MVGEAVSALPVAVRPLTAVALLFASRVPVAAVEEFSLQPVHSAAEKVTVEGLLFSRSMARSTPASAARRASCQPAVWWLTWYRGATLRRTLAAAMEITTSEINATMVTAASVRGTLWRKPGTTRRCPEASVWVEWVCMFNRFSDCATSPDRNSIHGWWCGCRGC